MKTFLLLTLPVWCLLFSVGAGAAPKTQKAIIDRENLSLRLEVGRAIERGVKWLAGEQNASTGQWGEAEYPALTGLAVRAIIGDPARKPGDRYAGGVEKGYGFILGKVQSDGGIYGKGLASYNTSICMMALLQSLTPEREEVARKARRFLVNQQQDFDKRGETDNVFDGGIGYGSRWAHSDLSNTHLSMEALFYAKKILEPKETDDLELDWDAAIAFVGKCQNLPGTNKEKWVSDAEEDKGGFVYFPGSSMAGERELAGGRKALRSYGSMSYAGLLSFIYAEMDEKDDRVVAVRQWIADHYTVKENPGMGPQGIYYYYHTMSKALTLSGVTILNAKDGSDHDWRRELAQKLFDGQAANGSWINENGRWWERDPVLVTSYALLTLERIYHSL